MRVRRLPATPEMWHAPLYVTPHSHPCYFRRFCPIAYQLLVLLFSLSFAFAQSVKVQKADAPAWVSPTEWKMPDGRQTGTGEGARYLLYEDQRNGALQESYERVVLLMQNETGVQDFGNLSFEFNPAYQDLIIHCVRIFRDGQTLDRLDLSKIRTIQPERQLYNHVVTGQQSALLFVEGLRVGDVLEYSLTTRGANPALAGHFYARSFVQSAVGLDRQRIKIFSSAGKPLKIRQHLTSATPVSQTNAGTIEYLWDFTNRTALVREDYTPASYERYPYIEICDFESWSDVVDWALPLYTTADIKPPPELQRLIDQWSGAPSREEQARLALQFVQDDLRYTAVSLGSSSHRPADPLETFEKRYGDCKGKVALSSMILKSMNFDACPALVDSSARGEIARRLPSMHAFDHVIIKLKLDGKTLWLDPTISHQGGRLWNRGVPSYAKALPISPGVAKLEDVQPTPLPGPLQHVMSSFRVGKPGEAVDLTIITTYRAAEADSTRERFARTDAEEIQKEYLNYYARAYPGIRRMGSLTKRDDRALNSLEVTERYRITNFWNLNKTKTKWECVFHADALTGSLTEPRTVIRQSPLWVPFPLHQEQQITLQLPEAGWESLRRLNPSSIRRFHFDCTGSSRARPPVIISACTQSSLQCLPMKSRATWKNCTKWRIC